LFRTDVLAILYYEHLYAVYKIPIKFEMYLKKAMSVHPSIHSSGLKGIPLSHIKLPETLILWSSRLQDSCLRPTESFVTEKLVLMTLILKE